jgi:hypothetical protein
MHYYRKAILIIRRGQSTLEYVIILAVVIGAIVAGGVAFHGSLASAYNAVYVNKK